MRQTYLIMATGAALAVLGLILLVTYPYQVGALSAEDFQDQWRPASKDSFKDYDEGDEVVIKDEIVGISYDSGNQLTKLRFEGGSKGDLELYFEGDVSDNFDVDDKVFIKTEVYEKSSKEELEGTTISRSLEEDAIYHHFTSTGEMAYAGLGIIGIIVAIAGGVLYYQGWDEEEEDEDDMYDFDQAPTGALPGGAPAAPQQPPAGGMTVACPTCQQPLMIVDPTRPLTVACPHCANPMMIQ